MQIIHLPHGSNSSAPTRTFKNVTQNLKEPFLIHINRHVCIRSVCPYYLRIHLIVRICIRVRVRKHECIRINAHSYAHVDCLCREMLSLYIFTACSSVIHPGGETLGQRSLAAWSLARFTRQTFSIRLHRTVHTLALRSLHIYITSVTPE